MFKVLLFILIAVVSPLSGAAERLDADTVLWFNAPQVRSDGEPLTTAEIDRYEITCGQTSVVMQAPPEQEVTYPEPFVNWLPERGEYECIVVVVDTEGWRSRPSNPVTVNWRAEPSQVEELGCLPDCDIVTEAPAPESQRLFADSFATDQPTELNGRSADTGQTWDAGPYFVAADGAVRYTRKYPGSAHINGLALPETYTIKTALAVNGLEATAGSKPASYIAVLTHFEDPNHHLMVLFTGQVMRLYETTNGVARLLTESAMPGLEEGKTSAPITINVEPARITVAADGYLLADEPVSTLAGTGLGLKAYNESSGPGYGLAGLEIIGQ